MLEALFLKDFSFFPFNILLHIVTHGATYLLMDCKTGMRHKSQSLGKRQHGGHCSFLFPQNGIDILCGIKLFEFPSRLARQQNAVVFV